VTLTASSSLSSSKRKLECSSSESTACCPCGASPGVGSAFEILCGEAALRRIRRSGELAPPPLLRRRRRRRRRIRMKRSALLLLLPRKLFQRRHRGPSSASSLCTSVTSERTTEVRREWREKRKRVRCFTRAAVSNLQTSSTNLNSQKQNRPPVATALPNRSSRSSIRSVVPPARRERPRASFSFSGSDHGGQ